MNEFFENLKREANANPVMALVIGTAMLTAAGKFIDAAGRYKGSNAFAKDVERRVRNSKK